MKVKSILLKLKDISKEVLDDHKVISIDLDKINPSFVEIVLVKGDRLRGSYEGVAQEVTRRALKAAVLKYLVLRNKPIIHGSQGNTRVHLYRKFFDKHTDLLFGLKTQFELLYPLFLEKLIKIYLPSDK